MAYSMRTVPPLAHAGALGAFGELIKVSLTKIAGTDVDERGWSQAALPFRAGGLGLRSVSDHSFAAYVASFKGARGLGVVGPHLAGVMGATLCGYVSKTPDCVDLLCQKKTPPNSTDSAPATMRVGGCSSAA